MSRPETFCKRLTCLVWPGDLEMNDVEFERDAEPVFGVVNSENPVCIRSLTGCTYFSPSKAVVDRDLFPLVRESRLYLILYPVHSTLTLCL
jgi:hypothetical protein